MEHVVGIGGYFIRARDPEPLAAWYRECLGVESDEHGLWNAAAGPTYRALAARLSYPLPRPTVRKGIACPPAGARPGAARTVHGQRRKVAR